MARDNDHGNEPTIFSAILTPHRSLGATGFLILMLCLGAASFATGVVFVLLGAWPVFGFLGLDVLLVYLAFRINYRSARAYEEVTVTASELTVRKVSPRGRVREEWTANPLWVRLIRTSMRNSAWNGCSSSLAASGYRSPVFSAPRKRKVLPRP